MNGDEFQQNWALWLAILPLIVVVLSVTANVWRRTARGQLARRIRDYRKSVRLAAEARKNHAKARHRVEQLEQRAAKTRPSVLEKAHIILNDSKALARIADERAQVAANHLRKVIYEEFPPDRQEFLRIKYLPEDFADRRPFSF